MDGLTWPDMARRLLFPRFSLVQWDVIPLCKSLCWDGYRRALQIHRERASLWPKGGYDVCRGPSSTVLFERQLHDRDDQRQPSITMGLLMQPAGE